MHIEKILSLQVNIGLSIGSNMYLAIIVISVGALKIACNVRKSGCAITVLIDLLCASHSNQVVTFNNISSFGKSVEFEDSCSATFSIAMEQPSQETGGSPKVSSQICR